MLLVTCLYNIIFLYYPTYLQYLSPQQPHLKCPYIGTPIGPVTGQFFIVLVEEEEGQTPLFMLLEGSRTLKLKLEEVYKYVRNYVHV